MEYKNITWQYGVTGYLSDEEKRDCEAIAAFLLVLKEYGFNVTVQISIENGNKFTVIKKGKPITAMCSSDYCKTMLAGMYVALYNMDKEGRLK